jgi:Zn-dependent peptidase ImmA (M78 family)
VLVLGQVNMRANRHILFACGTIFEVHNTGQLPLEWRSTVAIDASWCSSGRAGFLVIRIVGNDFEMPNIRPNTAGSYSKLRDAGFNKPFVRAVLPEWWSDEILTSGSGMVEFAGLVRQRLGVVSRFDEDGLLDVGPNISTAKLKQRKNTSEEKVRVTVSLAAAMSKLALQNFDSTSESDASPSPDTIRRSILDQGSEYVSLDSLLDYCWSIGIPVLRLENTPRGSQKAFGYAVAIEGRFAIVVGLNDRRPARIAFIVAHELGHISLGHVSDGTILADEVLSSIDESLEDSSLYDEEENQADDFALHLLRGADQDVELDVGTLSSASEVALAAMEKSAALSIDPGHIILSHAYRTRDWVNASLAHRFLGANLETADVLSKYYRERMESNLNNDVRRYLDTLQQY